MPQLYKAEAIGNRNNYVIRENCEWLGSDLCGVVADLRQKGGRQDAGSTRTDWHQLRPALVALWQLAAKKSALACNTFSSLTSSEASIPCEHKRYIYGCQKACFNKRQRGPKTVSGADSWAWRCGMLYPQGRRGTALRQCKKALLCIE